MSQKEKQQLLIYTLSLTIHQKSPAHSKQPTRDVSPSRPVNPFQHAPSPQGGRLPPELGLKIPGRKDRPGEGNGCLLHARAAATRFPPRPGRRPDIQGTEAPTLAWTGASTPDTCDEPAACRDLEDTGPWACRHSQGTRFASDGVMDMQTGNF